MMTLSCSKPENGTNGVDGKNGINGTNGAVGQTGNANVIYSDWAPVTFTASSPAQGNINAPKITQEILDQGTILVYAKLSNSYLQAPTSQSTSYIQVFLNLGNIGLTTNFSTNSFSSGFRYIIIPGGAPAGRSIAPKIDYKTMTYSQVCKSLNIPE